ncbi:hypothetical protein F441_00833 [Phytophthora nicotianae CJ01A1]|uniref:Uncharacterized protein n=5 Tax=Phytophthora nicotianae TaxID=4792 RepID=W2RG47_PHYN3|nr:hypothetical protein PPTG_00718 [Phytophthora nicotianae INRA-310]ETK96503.1 hypothetical protein L915_00793 [Phytophthora nicotianae]ETO85452.1 hypothetical protein F444_00817 [Phytophthora nicotianae P1976]ETP26552.1 hypothetical protein F441_00833 [Phytophthora nicotianae CJ01A1]ETP54525.1 hypothetical protein F442_00804 [Phytophthora nicotianae P10297]KUF77190.1 hypothetical protein AM587_10013637 [Phytophthora nicotianae]
MASADEIRAENESLAREIHALLNANTTLEKEMLKLSSERNELENLGNKKLQTLEQQLETVDEELTSLRSQCQSMTEIIENANAENEVEVEEEPAPVPVSRKLSSALNHTMQRARGMSMPRQRRSSTVEMVAHGLTKAASYMIPPTAKPSPDGPSRVRMSKDSPPILSYAKGTTDSTKSLLFSTHSHYGNFRRHSGPYRKNRDPPVMVL